VGVIKRIQVVICPRSGRFLAHLVRYFLAELGSKAQGMDCVRENMPSYNRGIKVIVQIVYVHIAIAETSPRCDMEVTHHLVHPDISLNTASFISLSVQSLCVMFSFALLHILTASKSPRHTSICLSYFVASITTAGLLCVWRRVCAVTTAAIIRIQMWSLVVSMKRSAVALSWNVSYAYKSKDLTSMTPPPLATDSSLTLLTPWRTPLCCSPDTSITSSVRSSQGI